MNPHESEMRMNDYEDYPDGRVCCMGCQIISGRTPFPHEAGCVVQRAEQAEALLREAQGTLEVVRKHLAGEATTFSEREPAAVKSQVSNALAAIEEYFGG